MHAQIVAIQLEWHEVLGKIQRHIARQNALGRKKAAQALDQGEDQLEIVAPEGSQGPSFSPMELKADLRRRAALMRNSGR